MSNGIDFFWTGNGQNLAYADWAEGQPNVDNENCLEVRGKFGLKKWNDWNCHEKEYFVCEEELIKSTPQPKSQNLTAEKGFSNRYFLNSKILYLAFLRKEIKFPK